ncbi:MAG TPA: outer membrane beta-barrel protein [Gemmatimonadales bacterium]|nr:outer membrane beta-barrel protein [Gemmatimonadales bacterium]
MRSILVVTALGLLAVSPAAAQKPQKGTWELGGFGRYNWYDDSFNESETGKNAWGGGGRIGYFFSPKWNVELDGSYNPTDLDPPTGPQSVGLTYMPFHLGVNYNALLSNKFMWHIGPRLNYNHWSLSDGASAAQVDQFEGSDFGLGAITGFRFKFSDAISARLDGTLDYIPSAVNEAAGSNTMLGVQLGLSAFLGGKCQGKIDSIRVEPKTQNIKVGDQATLRVTGYDCDGSTRDVSGASAAKLLAGAGALSGLTFTGQTPGCYDIEVSNPAARKKTTDTAKICVEAPPAPARVTLDRCELQPPTSTVPPGQTVNFRITGYYSDGTSRDLPAATINANGGTVTGRTYTAPGAAGTYTITAQCGDGKSATATVTVQSIKFTARALFEFNKSDVHVQTERDSLRILSDLLKQYPNLSLTIYGHTDWVGSVKYNEALGGRRIQAVMDTLSNYGIDKARMQAWTRTSYGECQPIANNKTKEGRALNRRVEVFDSQNAKQYSGTGDCRNNPNVP